jgi:RNA polymerase sigma factor (TIGR02999 family)
MQAEDDGALLETAPGTAAARSPSAWFELLYHELRRRARGQLFRYHALTMGPTTLLHEAWLKLADRPLVFATQAELVAYAGHTMRSIVINHIRDRSTSKRGGDIDFVSYDTLHDLRAMKDDDVLRLDDALLDLKATDAGLAELIELHFFAGLSFVELAALRGVSERTVRRDWDKARMLLATALRG